MAEIRTAINIIDGFSPVFKSLNNALGIVTASLADMQGQLSRPIDLNALNTAQRELAEAGAALDRLGDESVKASQKQRQLNSSWNVGSKTVDLLKSKVGMLLGAYASFEGVKGLITGADTYTSTNSLLTILDTRINGEDALQGADTIRAQIMQMANSTTAAFSTTADAVAKMGVQASQSFSSSDELIAFVEQVNKLGSIAGSNSVENMASWEGAMTQLTQAMGNGVLRGEELNSVLDGMPLVAQTIEKYFRRMGDARPLKEIAEQGLISSEIVKQALFSVADETNATFEGMGYTFTDLWNVFNNHAQDALTNTYKRLSEISNSKTLMSFAEKAGDAIAVLGAGIVGVIDLGISAATFIADNWSIIGPLFYGAATAAGVYGATLLAIRAYTIASAAAQAAYTGALTAYTAAVNAAKAAQVAYTAVLAAGNGVMALLKGGVLGLTAGFKALAVAMSINPFMLIVYAVIAIVAAFYGVIALINKFCGTSVSATGIIVGAFRALGAVVWDVFAVLWNGILNVCDNINNLVISLAEVVYNAFNGGFTGWIDGVKSVFWGLIDWIYQIIKPLIEVWDKFKGTDYAASLQTTITQQADAGKTDTYKTFARSNLRDQYGATVLDLGEQFNKGYEWGENFSLSDTVGGLFSVDDVAKQMGANNLSGLAQSQTDAAQQTALDTIARNTGDMAASMGTTKEELAYLREIGEREAINKFTTAEIKVSMNNTNTVNSALDIDDVMNTFADRLRQAVSNAADGVHV